MSLRVGVAPEDPGSFKVGGKVSSSAVVGQSVNNHKKNPLLWANKHEKNDNNQENEDNDDPGIRGETFQGHWKQMRGITAGQDVPSPDDMVAVLNLLAQMTSLLQMEIESEINLNRAQSKELLGDDNEEENSFLLGSEVISRHLGESAIGTLDSIREPRMPCLDLLLSDNILSHVLATSRMPIESVHADKLRLQQLRLYELLLSSSSLARTLLSHQPFLKPLIKLLNHFNHQNGNGNANGGSTFEGLSANSKDTELHLVIVLNQLCQCLKENPKLLEFFFLVTNNGDLVTTNGDQENKFMIFTLLVNYLHSPGHLGQLARDALLNCLILSKLKEDIGHFVAKQSNFCTVLATGLSGLYSALPRTLPMDITTDPDWCRISGDLQRDFNFHSKSENFKTGNFSSDLDQFLKSLEFCDSVVGVCHQKVKERLLSLIYMGFLVNVLGPALIAQNAESEVICSTAYLDLFLRKIKEPSLLAVFLKFLFVEKSDETFIIDTLTIRITSSSKLCQVTLSLFDTLVNLNCEDVMLWLIFRHLIPLKHLMPSQREMIGQPDLYGRAAEKLLSLTPICCQEASETFAEQHSQRSLGPNSGSMSFSQIFSSLGNRRNSNSENSNSIPNQNHEPNSSSYQNLSENFKLYLRDAKSRVRSKLEASRVWQYNYDGLNPSRISLENTNLESSENPLENSGGDLSSDESEEKPLDKSFDNNSSFGPLHSTCVNDVINSNNLATLSTSPSLVSGPVSMTAEEDTEFWNLMKDPTMSEVRLNKAIRRMQNHDELSLSSGLSQSGCSNPDMFFGCDISPRDRRKRSLIRKGSKISRTNEDVDFTVTSLGCFLDSLFEKVELMSTNSLTTNLLVTSIISNLASFPQPLLRSVLIQPDIVFQPSVRGLFTAIGSLRQKLDNIMPTLAGSEEAILEARRFLHERTNSKAGLKTKQTRKESNVSMASTLSHIAGHEASRHRSSISAAFTSIFRSGSGGKKSSGSSNSPNNLNSSAPASMMTDNSPNNHLTNRNNSVASHQRNNVVANLSREVKSQALAAVLLEEWLQELAAISQEQSALQMEMAYEFGMGLIGTLNNATTT